MPSANEAAPLVEEYSTKKILSRLGYRFDSDDLTDFDVECMTLIASEFAKLEAQEIKSASRKKG